MTSRVAGVLLASRGARNSSMICTTLRTARSQHRWQTRSAAAAIDPSLPRIYRYWIDVHGQLFLYDTVPKNLTSCFKSAQFLNFFFARVEPLPTREKGQAASEPREDDEATHWTEDPQELAKVMLAHDGSPPSEAGWAELWKRLHSEGLTWLSKCQGEWNVIHAVDTPVVFRTLSEDGVLTWGGDYTMPMDPAQLLVHPETGYLYHPSPYPPLSRWQRRAQEGAPSPYGRYSLISSYAVLQRLAQGLDIDPELHQSERRDDGRPCAGTVEWRGERHRLGLLDPEQDVAQP